MKTKGNKRKNTTTNEVKQKDIPVNNEDSDESDEFCNVINGEDEDSSDSDYEVEESDGEMENVMYENNEDVVSEEESANEDEELEDDDDEESESDDEDESESENEESDDDNEDDMDKKNDVVDEEESEEEIDDDSESENEVETKENLPRVILKNHINKTISAKTNNEYADNDTSDEEDIRNTIGNVPKNWYDEYKHLGYDWDGNKIIKPETGDRLDEFLKKVEDPDFWRTVKDPQTGQDVVLTDEDIELIRRINGQKLPDDNFDEYAPWIEWFSNQVMQMPVRKFPEHKRSFLPSKSEAKKVSRLVHALKMGWIKTREEEEKERQRKKNAGPQFYMIWSMDDKVEEMRRLTKHIPAPKRRLPDHAESYNPPPEYLFDAKEMKEWNKLKDTPWKRKLHYIPQKYDSLRKVPAYSRFIKERFLRCLDLYLCPRAIKMKLNIEPEELVPKLPSPKDLQPFPNVKNIMYAGHKDMIRTMSIDKYGQYLVTGSDDTTIKIWEVNTGRCIKTIETEGVVRCVKWCPNQAISLILVASGNRVLLVNPKVGDFVVSSKTDQVLNAVSETEVIISERVRNTVQWEKIDETGDDYVKNGYRLLLKHFKEVTQVTWHGKGDYFASVMPDGQNRSVLISQLSRRRSQLPFNKSKGLVQCVLFHPTRPILFVATQRHVRIYDLLKQQLIKKLMTNSKWISTMDVHPGGDNLLVGTYDRKMLWFDLDLSTKPYQTLRLHGTAVRGVAYHKRYPLFASCSDDRSLVVSHGMVYNDLLKNPLIVPLKRLQDHESNNDFGCFDVLFHPTQPWVFSSGADGTVILYCN